MMDETLRPMLFSIADALEMDLDVTSFRITGKRKAVYEVFEGYSPTVVAQVTDSLIDEAHGMVCVIVHIWGNLKIMVINDKRSQELSLFVFDRAKEPQELAPFGAFWSRKNVYSWLGDSCQAIYRRSVFDTVWARLPSGKQKLKEYNQARAQGAKASTAYNDMWDQS